MGGKGNGMEEIPINLQSHRGVGVLKILAILGCASLLAACSNDDTEQQSAGTSKVKLEQPKTDIGAHINKADAVLQGNAAPSEVGALQEAVEEQELEKGSVPEEIDEPTDPYEGSKVKLVERSEGVIEWEAPIDVEYSKAEVTIVTQAGERVNYSFGPNESMMLESSLPDGLYQWESVVTPEIDPYVMDQMRSARNSGDISSQEQIIQRLRAEGSYPTEEELKNNRQAGAFVVREGVVTPTTTKTDDGQDG